MTSVAENTAKASVHEASARPGLSAALRALLEHGGDHLSLLRHEAGEELSRLGQVLSYWFALALFVQLVIVFALTLLMATAWDTAYRTHAIVFSAAVLLAGVGYCIWQLRNVGRRASASFAASGEQWRRDLDLIRELL